MGLAEIQRAIARLSVDRALRERFFADPAAEGGELGLDLDECRKFASIPRQQVERFAGSLRDKRRTQIRRTIPVAARAMGRSFAVSCERYMTGSVPRGSKADLDDAAGFVAAMRRGSDRIEPPWAIDLARYELAGRQAVGAGRAPIVRIFGFPVARLAIGRVTEPVLPRTTLAFWWRPTSRGRVRHFVVSIPTLPWRRK